MTEVRLRQRQEVRTSKEGRRRALSGMLGAILLAALLVFSGCARPASTTTTSAITSTAAPASTLIEPYGTVRFGINSFDQEVFDPTLGGAATGLLMASPILDPLLTANGTKAAPGVADSWELAPDGLSWTFRIHKGVKFHNGDDLTAKDVKFSIERYMAPAASQSNMKNAVASVDLLDDYALRVNTKGPQPFLPLMVSYFYPAMGWIQPKDYIEKNGIEYFKSRPVGSGPFKFVSHAPGDSVKFEALEKHWRKVPAFKNLEISLVPEEATRIAAVKTGMLDIIDVSLDGGNIMENTGLRTAFLASSQAYVVLWGAYVREASNVPTYDIRVRKALSLAINRDEIAKGLFYGKTKPALPAFMVDEAGQDLDLPYWRDLAAKSYAKYDPRQAKSLLNEAGYANGLTIKFWSYPMAGGAYFPKLVETIASYWQNVGVKAEIVPSDFGSMIAVVNTLKNPALRGVAGLIRVTGRPVAAQVLFTYVASTSSWVMLGTQFPNIDKQVAALYAETDANKRRVILAETVATVADAYVGLPLGGVPMVAGIGPRVDFPAETYVPELSIYAERVMHRK